MGLEEAVNKWSVVAHDMHNIRTNLKHGAMWWRSARLSQAFQMLQHVAREAERDRAMTRMAYAEWAQYEAWKAIVAWQRKAEQLRMLKAELLDDGALGIQHWNKQSLENTVDCWYQSTFERLQMLQDRRDAILNWAEQQLVTSVNRWRLQTFLRLSAFDSFKQGLAFWSAGLLMDGLLQWRQRVSNWRLRADTGHDQAISKWRHDTMSCTFNDWRQGTTSLLQADSKFKEGNEYCKFRITLDALSRWRDYTEFCNILSELMKQADFRCKHKSYSDGFQAWRKYSDMHIKMECDSPEK